ncbi:hypothetical protein BGZ63DRAFT_435722 [Mariannaea sp. PMI_226]|nr:hypothetical protein BGZ63DRAFT_435722 [Mariannaea sp. PMI_226]
MAYSQRIITDTNKAPLIQVLTLMFLVIAILACFVRSGTKIHMIKRLRLDDTLAVLATVFAIGQSITVFAACESGLGKPFDTLSFSKTDTFFKIQYAANAMFIASLLCAKFSGTIGLRMMSRNSHKWIILTCEIIVGLWGFSALFVNFFQCQLPTPWDYSDRHRCINRNVAIVAIMIESARKIHTSWSKKILVISVFGSRIFVVPAVVVQIIYSNRAFASDDFTFSAWEAAITVQLVQCLAIFTVCVPNLKPFLDSLESGQNRVDDLRRQGKSSSNGYATYKPGHSGYRSAQNSAMASRSRPAEAIDELATSTSQRNMRGDVHELAKKESWDGQSHISHTSQTILIHQTWQVDVQSVHDNKSPS